MKRIWVWQVFQIHNWVFVIRVRHRLFGVTGNCAACSKLIPAFEMVMRAKENVYHLDCFACQLCNQRWVNGPDLHTWNHAGGKSQDWSIKTCAADSSWKILENLLSIVAPCGAIQHLQDSGRWTTDVHLFHLNQVDGRMSLSHVHRTNNCSFGLQEARTQRSAGLRICSKLSLNCLSTL